MPNLRKEDLGRILILSLPLTLSFEFITFPSYAANPLNLQETNLPNLQQQFNLSLPKTQDTPNLIQLIKTQNPQNPDSLKFLQQHNDKNKTSHIRLQQEYMGYPVFGGYAIIHKSTLNNTIKLNGKVYKGLAKDLGQPQANFTKNSSIALNNFKNRFPNKKISQEEVTPIVYLDEHNIGHWAYKVSIFIQNTDNIPDRPTAILDAQTYQPLLQWNDIKTVRNLVKGQGFGGNAKIGQYTYGHDFPFLEITRESRTQHCYLENPHVRIVDMRHQFTSVHRPMRFSCMEAISQSEKEGTIFWTGYKSNGYDTVNSAYSPTNDAFFAGQVIKNLYKDWFNLEALTQRNGTPKQLVMRVHYGDGYENAYWDGDTMTFGDGGSIFYPLVSLGVSGHEVSHGFTEQHSNLVYVGQSGGLNESFSDMAAQATEFYALGHNSWKIGEEIIKPESGYSALRFMDQPSKDGSSIDKASQYKRGLDVHYSSGVFNRLFYLIASNPDWGVRKTFHVMVKANTDYWTPYSNFEDAGCGVLNAAKNLKYDLTVIKKALEAVDIQYTSCAI